MSICDLFPESYQVWVDGAPVADGSRPEYFDLNRAVDECVRRAAIARGHSVVMSFEGVCVYQALLISPADVALYTKLESMKGALLPNGADTASRQCAN